jgi:hypothetical protein
MGLNPASYLKGKILSHIFPTLNEEFLRRVSLIPLIRQGPHRKRRIHQLFYSCLPVFLRIHLYLLYNA